MISLVITQARAESHIILECMAVGSGRGETIGHLLLEMAGIDIQHLMEICEKSDLPITAEFKDTALSYIVIFIRRSIANGCCVIAAALLCPSGRADAAESSCPSAPLSSFIVANRLPRLFT